MKSKILFTMMTLLFPIGMATVSAQTEKDDTIVVREGNWIYIKYYNNRIIERLETKDMRGGKSYEPKAYRFSDAHSEQVIKPMFRSVFSKERAKELSDGRLLLSIVHCPVEDRILHISFYWKSKEEKDFPVTLQELVELERKFRADTKNLIPVDHSPSFKIIDSADMLSIPIRFGKLYDGVNE